jgi:hypothetical protein
MQEFAVLLGFLTENIDGPFVHDMEQHEQVHGQQTEGC